MQNKRSAQAQTVHLHNQKNGTPTGPVRDTKHQGTRNKMQRNDAKCHGKKASGTISGGADEFGVFPHFWWGSKKKEKKAKQILTRQYLINTQMP